MSTLLESIVSHKGDIMWLCIKDGMAVLVKAPDIDGAYFAGGKLLGVVADEVEDIDLDTVAKIELNELVKLD